MKTCNFKILHIVLNSKIFGFIFICLFYVNFLNAQIFTESFEEYPLPDNWEFEVVEGEQALSTVNTSSRPSGYTAYDGTFFIRFNSYDVQNTVNRLKTKNPVDITGYTNLELRFAWLESSSQTTSNDFVTVQWSINGTDWNDADTYYRYNSEQGWKIKTCNLPSEANNQANLYLAFQFTTAYGSNCFLDYVKLYGTFDCAEPTQQATGLSVTGAVQNELTINWNSGNGTGGALVMAKMDEAVNEFPVSSNTYTTSTQFGNGQELGSGNFAIYSGDQESVTITGLQASTSYHIAIFEFNSADNCYNLVPLTGIARTAGPINDLEAFPSNETVTLKYTAPGDATSVTLMQKEDGGVYEHVMTLSPAQSSATITNLQNETNYFYRIDVTGGIFDGSSNEVSAMPRNIMQGGELTGNLGLEKSPYIIAGDIIIPNGELLTIEPGVRIEFDGYYKIDVQGAIQANGTIDNPIVITTTLAQKSDGWNGLHFEQTPAENETSVLHYCEISNAKAKGDAEASKGGALYVKNFSKLNISFSKFTNNSADDRGGAIHLIASYCTIENCLFQQNTTSGRGGVISLNSAIPVFRNNIMVENSSGLGGVGFFYNSSPILYNNTIINNTAGAGGAFYLDVSEPHFYNTIIWGNSTGGGQITLGNNNLQPVFHNCIVQAAKAAFGGSGASDYDLNGSKFANNNNLDADPLFVDPGNDDWNIQRTSPALNTGYANAGTEQTGTKDFKSINRILFNRVDIGAMEYPNTPPESISLSESSVPENAPVGSIVGELTTTDTDNDLGDTHIYSMENGVFAIEGSSVVTASTLDYEKQTEYIISVNSTDTGNESVSSVFTITVDDVAFGSIQIQSPPMHSFVNENTEIAFTVSPELFNDLAALQASFDGENWQDISFAQGENVVILSEIQEFNQVSEGECTLSFQSISRFNDVSLIDYQLKKDTNAPDFNFKRLVDSQEVIGNESLEYSVASPDDERIQQVSFTINQQEPQSVIGGAVLQFNELTGFSSLPYGVFTFSISISDIAGNVGERTYTFKKVSELSPVAFLPSGQKAVNTDQFIKAKSNISGWIYLVHESVESITIEALENALTVNKAASIIVDAVNTNTLMQIQTNGLVHGSYSAYTVTEDYEISSPSTHTAFVIDAEQNTPPESIILSTLFIADDLAAQSVVADVSVTDPDSWDEITIQLAEGNGENDKDNNSFQVSGNQIITNEKIDYATKKEYALFLKATDLAGVSTSQAFVLEVQPAVLFVKNQEDKIRIYPNPVKNFLYVDYPSKNNLQTNGKLAIMTLTGRVVYSNSVTSFPVQVNLLPYPKGIYLLKLFYQNKTLDTKFMIH